MHTGLSNVGTKRKISIYTPCISIYLPTNKKLDTTFKTRDRIKLMRLINKVEKHLYSNQVEPALLNKILKPVKAIIEDQKFWINQKDSLVIFMTEDFFEYYQLPVKCDLGVFIDNEFNVEPLALLMSEAETIHMPVVSHEIKPLSFTQKIA